MTLKRLALTLLASLVLAAAGCGGDDDGGDGGGGGAETAAPETAAPETAAPETQQAGGAAETFATTCGGCHTLAAANTNGQVGPNLDDLKPDAQRVTEAIEQGPGVMPENLLEGAEAEEVAQYVADNAGG